MIQKGMDYSIQPPEINEWSKRSQREGGAEIGAGGFGKTLRKRNCGRVYENCSLI